MTDRTESNSHNDCKDSVRQPFAYSMAFQPIVDVEADTVYAYEALVRGPNGEPAETMLRQVIAENRYAFDQTCRVKAIPLAARLGLTNTSARLSRSISCRALSIIRLRVSS